MISTFTRWLNAEKLYINDEYAPELSPIKAEDITHFYPSLLAEAHAEILAHGNLYKSDALSMTKMIEDTLQFRPLPPAARNLKRNVIIPDGSSFTYKRKNKDPANVNHCIEYFLYVGGLKDRDLRARLQLLAQLAEEPAFDQLRTKEQLGYIVWSGVRTTATTMGYRVIIQSEQTNEYLETRIDAFLERVGKDLEEMSADTFEGHRRSLINRRLEKLKNLDSETSRFTNHIDSEYYDFYQVDEDVAKIREVTKTDLLGFYKKFIDPVSSQRAKLSIHLDATAKPSAASEIDVEEQREQFVTIVSQALAPTGLTVDSDKVRDTFKTVELASDNLENMLGAMKKLVPEGTPTEKVNALMDQGKQLLPQILGMVGIKPPVKEVSPTENGVEDKSTGVIIDDVYAWKAKLEVSKGATPVVSLSEYEEHASKL